LNDGYVVIDIEPAKNRVNGGFMFKIRLLEITSQQVFVTYIDPANRNYINWSWVIEDHLQGQVLTNLKKIKQGKKTLIDADSVPARVYVGPRSTIDSILKEYWNRKPNQYDELFEEKK
jgi:hypothetical protein